MIITHVKRSPFQLRWYQTEAVEAFNKYVAEGGRATLISASTGSGKTLIIADIAKQYVLKHKQVLILTHRKELIQQNEKTLKKHISNVKIGVISASCKRKEFEGDVLIGGIQTVIRNLEKIPYTNLLIVDEAHHISTDSQTSYYRVITHLRNLNPDLIVLGLSATIYRLDQGLLYEGNDRLFDSCCYEVGIAKLMEEGYLCPLISKSSSKVINVKKLHTKMGEFDQQELQIEADNEELTNHVVQELVTKCADRKSWIIFTTGVKHSEHVSEKLTELGITNAIITGETEPEVRADIIERFKNGEMRAIVNCAVLTEGFDNPDIDAVVLLTATKSPNKYVQCLGRGLRISDKKKDCLVLDYGENVMRLGFLTDVKIPKESKREKKDVKECPDCHLLVKLNTKTCPECGHIFGGGVKKLNHVHYSYDGDIVGTGKKERLNTDSPHWNEVVGVTYKVHHKEGKEDTFQIVYQCKEREYVSTFLSMSPRAHPYAYSKSLDFVKNMLGGKALTIEQCTNECKSWKVPNEIFIVKNGDYKRIKNYHFS